MLLELAQLKQQVLTLSQKMEESSVFTEEERQEIKKVIKTVSDDDEESDATDNTSDDEPEEGSSPPPVDPVSKAKVKVRIELKAKTCPSFPQLAKKHWQELPQFDLRNMLVLAMH